MGRILEGYRNGSIEYRSTGKDTGGISEWIYRMGEDIRGISEE
jgi:hypothetical protein